MIASSLGVIATPAAAAGPARPADFDGDGDTDIAVFRPASGAWFMNGGDTTAFGTSGDAAVPGDYDGDGDADVAVYRPTTGVWFVHGGPTVQFGTAGDIPVPGDYDGNGTTDIAVFRPASGYWFVHGGGITQFGTAGDVPVPGDYDGNGTTDIAVYRPTSGYWFVHGGQTTAWGTAGDFPVPGDYDGDGDADLGVYRQSIGVWFVNGGASTQFGTAGDLPAPGNYDADPATDIAVFRPTGGLWFVEGGGAVPWGTTGDVPVPLPAAIHGYATATVLSAGPRLLAAAADGDDKVRLTFDRALAPSAADPTKYSSSPNLFTQSATLLNGSTDVLLTTGSHYQVSYTVTAGSGVTDTSGNAVDPSANRASFVGTEPIGSDRPRVTTATSTGNTRVVVQFSNPMADNALDPSRYSVVQENVNPEVGTVGVTGAQFARPDRLSVELTTLSQNEVTYRVKVGDVTDLARKPLADRTTVGGVLVDPTSTTFAGTPPTTDERVDTDGDGLYDNEETLGWTVIVQLATGAASTRQVTSSPTARDTDKDGLEDYQEKTLNIDPRDDDTDDDQLPDAIEYNEIYSDPTQQDSDGDELTDGLEVTFFRTSAILEDTDGDQLADGSELNLARRNPKVADLPKPALEIGDMNLALDVRFLDSTATETKTVDEKRATSALRQSDKNEFTRSQSRTVEASLKLSHSTEAGIELEKKWGKEAGGSVKGSFKTSFTHEHSFSSSFTSAWSETSSRETESAYEKSLRSEEEVSAGATRTREVNAAQVQVGVMLKAAGNIAFNVKNLQVSAMIQDPQDPSRLTPIATLLPTSEPSSGFNLGPLVPARGPIIFSNDQVFPTLVEDLMRNPRGLVFRFANYDVVDELGRNFAFASQDINDRTARLVIDHGGFDGDGDGIGDDAEVVRVATGTGRRVKDTNGDGVIDEADRRVVFDDNGKQVGITLRDALRSMGLQEYDEGDDDTATEQLTQSQIDNSYSVWKFLDDNGNPAERIHRIRRTRLRNGVPNEWLVIKPTGIDYNVTLDNEVLEPGGDVTLGFAADRDRDAMPALLESINRCVDSPIDTDGDGRADSIDTDRDTLDDRFEVLVGWKVTTERGSRNFRSRCSTTDTDNDTLSDGFEAPAVLQRDDGGRILFDTNHEPLRDISGVDPDEPNYHLLLTLERAPNPEGLRDDPLTPGSVGDPVTNPASPDTDVDGLSDSSELTPYQVELRNPEDPSGPPAGVTPPLITSPERFDSDDDTASDFVEVRLGGNPRQADFGNFGDSDGDGLVNAQERAGFDIVVYPARARTMNIGDVCPGVCEELPEVSRRVFADENNPDTDRDGLSDVEELDLKTDPSCPLPPSCAGADTDADGLSDSAEVRGFTLPGQNRSVTTDPNDADTDNDKRTDGEEANLFSSARMIVRVPGKAPYQVFSHPLEPDADFDLLVDGDEASWGSDAQNWNTDEDTRSDYSEVIAGRRPFVPDLVVRLAFGNVHVAKDGDVDGQNPNSGEFYFDLGAAPNANPVSFTSRYPVTGKDVPGLPHCSTNTGDFNCRIANNNDLIQLRDGTALRSPVTRFADVGAISTTDAHYEEFQIIGTIEEHDSGVDCRGKFPDLLEPLENSGVVPGSSLRPGTGTISLRREVHCLQSDEIMDVTIPVTYTAR